LAISPEDLNTGIHIKTRIFCDWIRFLLLLDLVVSEGSLELMVLHAIGKLAFSETLQLAKKYNFTRRFFHAAILPLTLAFVCVCVGVVQPLCCKFAASQEGLEYLWLKFILYLRWRTDDNKVFRCDNWRGGSNQQPGLLFSSTDCLA
jgi:hypothetical protein